MKRILSALFVAFFCLSCRLLAQPGTLQVGSQIEEWRVNALRQIEQTKQALAKEPALGLYYKLGGLYNLLGQWSEAADAYTKGLALKPDHAESHLALGWCYAKANRYEEALVSHQRAANLKPKEVEGVFAIGWDQYSLKRYEEAIVAYQQAIAKEPKYAGAYYELGRTYIALEKRELAIEQLQILEKRDGELAKLLQREIDRMKPRPIAAAPQAENKEVPQLPAIQTAPPSPTEAPPRPAFQVPSSLRPVIHYQERAKYTEAARQSRVNGTVLLSVVFTLDGRVSGVRVLRGLPMGLSEQAVKATEAIRFTPAKKNGNPVSVRMSIEFVFNLL